jgi:hypothetical protein
MKLADELSVGELQKRTVEIVDDVARTGRTVVITRRPPRPTSRRADSSRSTRRFARAERAIVKRRRK